VVLYLPIHKKFEVAVVGHRTQAVPAAVKDQHAIGHRPVGPHLLISCGLSPGQLAFGHPGSTYRTAYQPLPPIKVLGVEKGNESLRRLIQCLHLPGRT